MKRIFAQAFAAWLLLPLGQSHALAADNSPAGRYEVTLHAHAFEALDVTAHITRTSGRIFPGVGGGSYLKGGWTSVIENLAVRTPDGRPVQRTLKYLAEYGAHYWALTLDGKPYSGPIDLRYRVNLGYAKKKHPYGNEQGGQAFARSLYTVAKPVFVASDIEGAWRVHFDLPAGMRVAYPLKHADASSAEFVAPDFSALQDNPITIGKFFQQSIAAGAATLDLVLPHVGDGDPQAVLQTARKVMTLYGRLLPGGRAGRYQVVMFPSYADDGESYTNATVVTSSQPFSAKNRLVWTDLLAHELFHFWNGVRLASASAEETQWFSEGFTEYYAVLAQVNLGLIGPDVFEKHLEQNYANYRYFLHSGLYKDASLQSAGKAKARNRFGVYNGGFVVALSLDMAIHERTGGRKSLDDVMQSLFANFALKERHFTPADIVKAVSAVAGTDYTTFFEAHVDGRMPIDAESLFSPLGFNASTVAFAGEAYLERKPHPSRAERANWRWLTKTRFRRTSGGG